MSDFQPADAPATTAAIRQAYESASWFLFFTRMV
jgi:hypothetical protein